MSHLWRNRIDVLLGAETLSLQYAPSVLSRQQSFQKTTPLTTAGEMLWQQALNQLQVSLAQLKEIKNADLYVMLSSEFVRYLVLPPQGGLANAIDVKAYAQAFFNDIYGDIAQTWRIAIDDAAPHLPSIAVAMDETLYTQLHSIVDQYGLTLKKLEPFITTAVNFLHQEIGNTTGYLAIIEQRRVLLLRLKNGQFTHLKVDVIRQHWQQTLSQLLMRKDALNLDEFSPQPTQAHISEFVLLFTPFLAGGSNGKLADLTIKSVGLPHRAQPKQFLTTLQSAE